MPDSIEHLLSQGKLALAECEQSALESRILLAHCLQVEQTYLLTWPEKVVQDSVSQQFKELLEQRKNGKPIAYLIGYRDFWSLRLRVSSDTLIPRPDTELLVSLSIALPLPQESRVLDLGTGTGAIALSLASEQPDWDVHGVDKVQGAVALAIENQTSHNITNAQFYQSDWFSNVEGKFDLIVSNPPYVESTSPFLALGDVRFEPHSALTSGPDGLDDIRLIIQHVTQFLKPKGWLLFEHGFEQGDQIRSLLLSSGFSAVKTVNDFNELPRVSLGQFG